jgi:uncharacterized protein
MKTDLSMEASPCSRLPERLAQSSPCYFKRPMEAPSLPADLIPTQDEKNLGIIMHVLSLCGFSLIGPLIVWLVKKDESAFIDAQGRELLNFQLSFVIYAIVSGILCLILIGFVLLAVLAVLWFIFTIIGLVKATEGKVYKFPLTFRML